MELAPVFRLPAEEVAKASQGHDPLPFLISDCKELDAKVSACNPIFQKNSKEIIFGRSSIWLE